MALDRVGKLMELFGQAKSVRHNWEGHWQEVADLVLPTREFSSDLAPGQRVRDRLYDDTGPVSAIRLSAALDGLNTNDAMRWFQLKFADQDDEARQDRDAQLWLREVTRRMYDVFNHPAGGWGASKFEVYQDLVGFGNSVMQVLPSRDSPIRFRSRPLGETYVTRDDEGHVYAVFRSFSMTAREIAERWKQQDGSNVNGPSREVMKKADDPKKGGDAVSVLHVVMRREDRDPMKIDSVNKPWASFYIEQSEKHLISESGFDDNPFVLPRWDVASGEEYGRGPGMVSLPSIRTVNVMQRDQLTAGQLALAPPVSVSSNSMEGPINLNPHAINWRRPGHPGDAIQPINTGARPDIGEQMISARQQMIASNFFLDMLTLPSAGDAGAEGHPRMSATESTIRLRQKQQLMAPFQSRLKTEFLGEVIRLVFTTMGRKGMLPDPPPSVRGRRLDVEYFGPLSISQRASEVSDMLEAMQSIAPLTAVDESAAMAIDADEAVRHILDLLHINPKVIKSRQDVARMRQDLEQNRAAAQQAQIARDAGSAVKDVAAGIGEIQQGAGA